MSSDENSLPDAKHLEKLFELLFFEAGASGHDVDLLSHLDYIYEGANDCLKQIRTVLICIFNVDQVFKISLQESQKSERI